MPRPSILNPVDEKPTTILNVRLKPSTHEHLRTIAFNRQEPIGSIARRYIERGVTGDRAHTVLKVKSK